MHIDKIRLLLLCVAWLKVIIDITVGQSALFIANLGLLSLLLFIVLTFRRPKKESLTIITILVIVAFFMLEHLPSFEDYLSAGRFTLVFFCITSNYETFQFYFFKCEKCKKISGLAKKYSYKHLNFRFSDCFSFFWKRN